ncbi:MAG: thioesterase family protein [Syntrophorhabdales bacterium]|jgi:4-hydroxybenzoyl-CoA thioesterase
MTKRLRLVEQERYTFCYPARVEPRDISPGGHLGADNIVMLLSLARAYVFHSMGLAQEDLGDGVGIVMVDIAVNYKAEAFLFDEVAVDTQFGAFVQKGFSIYQRVRKGKKVLALAETGILTFDYRSRKVAPVPERFLKALAARRKE